MTVRGPDLEAGVPTADIGLGEMLVGQYKGEEVLLVRHHSGLSAIGARCSHYGAPLDAGLIVGDQIRCPWHHAGFCVRDGRAERAPALADLQTYDVEESGGVARILRRRTLPRATPPRADAVDVVIVGGGAAGLTAVETLRRQGGSGAITLIDAEPGLPVDRPNLSKDYLAGKAPEAWLFPRDTAFYEGIGVRRVQGVVTELRPGERTVVLDSEEIHYDVLLLAPGAEPRRLGMPGSDKAHVHTLRSLADCRRILAVAARATDAVVIGAGFLGLEVAGALRAQGMAVTVVAPEATPFATTLGEDLGVAVVDAHMATGVRFRLSRQVVAIRDDSVELSDGSTISAQLVVIAVGAIPRTDLARDAGFAVEDGILVDSHLATNIPHVWAAGDAASWWSPRFGMHLRSEHWVTAQRMGQVAAMNMLGQPQPFDAIPFFWTCHGDRTINWVGHPVGFDDYEVDGSISDGDCAVTYRRAGSVVAVATIGRDLESLRAEVRLEGGQSLPPL